MDASTNVGEHQAGSGSVGARKLEERRRLRAIAGGSHAALGETYDLFGPGAYRLALGVLGDAVLAEQVVEEAFLTLWRRAGSGAFEDTPVAVWLVRFVQERVRESPRMRNAQAEPQPMRTAARSALDRLTSAPGAPRNAVESRPERSG